MSTLEKELTAARTSKTGSQVSSEWPSNHSLPKAFIVIGINTAFSSKQRRDSIRETWMPTGHSATTGGVLDRAINAEEAKYKYFLRLNHVKGYHELSSKTRLYFSKVVSIWNAEFYVKVDDDVHVNLDMLMSTLARYRSKPRIYVGCMKPGPVLSKKTLFDMDSKIHTVSSVETKLMISHRFQVVKDRIVTV
ncbi:unnamed protein product, partial [Ilex paraguariensis]